MPCTSASPRLAGRDGDELAARCHRRLRARAIRHRHLGFAPHDERDRLHPGRPAASASASSRSPCLPPTSAPRRSSPRAARSTRRACRAHSSIRSAMPAAIVIVGVFFARALWSRGLTTFADLFRQRYSPGVERLVVIVLLPGSVIWAAAQVRAFGQVLSANSGMGLATAITWRPCWWRAYSVVGGLLADAVTDVIQGVAVVLGLLILGAVVAAQWGASPRAWRRSSASSSQLARREASWLATLEQLAIPICGTIVAVELISRFLGARTADVAAHRHRARRRHLSGRRAHSGVPRTGRRRASAAGVADAEQIVAKLAEALSARRALCRLRRRHHLGDPVGGARGPARARLADLAQHRGPDRSRHQRSRQAVVACA